jgi:hypothetical protein
MMLSKEEWSRLPVVGEGGGLKMVTEICHVEAALGQGVSTY